jgi:hypothetical protein
MAWDPAARWYQSVVRWCMQQSRPALWPTQPPIQWYRVSFPGVKRPGRGVDYPHPSSARIKERVELYLYSPSEPSWPVVGRTLPLLYLLRWCVCPRSNPNIPPNEVPKMTSVAPNYWTKPPRFQQLEDADRCTLELNSCEVSSSHSRLSADVQNTPNTHVITSYSWEVTQLLLYTNFVSFNATVTIVI